MKKVMMGMLVMGVLLVSLASAGLVGFLSNTITGEIVVEGPVFWLDDELDEDNDYVLVMNDNSVSGEDIEMIGKVISQIKFKSESLGIDSFYDEKFVVNLDLEAINVNESRSSRIGIEIFSVDKYGDEDSICDNVLLNAKDRDVYPIECVPSGHSLNNLDVEDKLMLKIDRMTTSSNYTIYIGESYIGVLIR